MDPRALSVERRKRERDRGMVGGREGGKQAGKKGGGGRRKEEGETGCKIINLPGGPSYRCQNSMGQKTFRMNFEIICKNHMNDGFIHHSLYFKITH